MFLRDEINMQLLSPVKGPALHAPKQTKFLGNVNIINLNVSMVREQLSRKGMTITIWDLHI